MKTILLICAIAAFACALPSDDVETDLLTPNDIVPESELVEATATAGYWVKCTEGKKDKDCGKKNGYYTTAQKGYKWVGAFNIGVRPSHHSPRAKLCKDLHQESPRQVCRCKGKDHTTTGAIPCFSPPGTPAYKKMSECGSNGYAWSSTCSDPKGHIRPVDPPPPKPKTCACTVYQGHKKRKHVHTQLGGRWKKDWMSHNQGFKAIKCTGCVYVKLHDDDHPRWADHHILGRSPKGSCCGKKTCSFTLPYDLEDDIKQVDLGAGC